jgi:hypothetical protein
MGYNTNFTLCCSDNDLLVSLFEEDDDIFGHFEVFKGKGVAQCKWYDHESDMRAISAKHRGVVFTLHGEGEEGGDLWNKYFLNGKMQTAFARIEYDSFDSLKLI